MAFAAVVATANAASAASEKADPAEKSAESGEKRVCRRIVDTGSLVNGSRVCKPKREWQRGREISRQPRADPGRDSEGN
jgi:hypothetical protein